MNNLSIDSSIGFVRSMSRRIPKAPVRTSFGFSPVLILPILILHGSCLLSEMHILIESSSLPVVIKIFSGSSSLMFEMALQVKSSTVIDFDLDNKSIASDVVGSRSATQLGVVSLASTLCKEAPKNRSSRNSFISPTWLGL